MFIPLETFHIKMASAKKTIIGIKNDPNPNDISKMYLPYEKNKIK